MLINLVAHTCVPQGVGSEGNCFVSVVSFISVALCRQTNVDSFVFAALLAALHWSAISFIINFHFSNFTANAEIHTPTHKHTQWEGEKQRRILVELFKNRTRPSVGFRFYCRRAGNK